ncbi:iron complex transport system permease protein [Alkalicoccobacillus murimartini]|uniref:Iron complex transport system permease protein n=1 Tax=Alkalicoccobacillus murimartini TaxID=171685 RepID=A0ABT9YH58_9BACI|nr:iron complex transport system permease protein [Alkalicoccobacillus murimartini]
MSNKKRGDGAVVASSGLPPDISVKRSLRPLMMLIGGFIALVLTLFISLTQGRADVSVHDVTQALFNRQDLAEHHLIWANRLPRAVMGIISGCALAVAGALMQTVTRNPLASETTLGVNAGAYLAVITGMIFFPALQSQFAFPIAVLGGAGAAAAVFALGGGRRSTPIRVALSGMIVTLVLSSVTSALIMLNQQTVQGVFLWGSGSLVQNDWSGASFSWPWVVGGILLVCLTARQLDVLTLNEETSKSLGQKVRQTRFLAMTVAVVIACVSVSVVGPIGFIGLVAPHLVRMMGVRKHIWLLPISALWGAVVLLLADTIARSLIDAYGELPAGAITAAIGAPWLIWLALRMSKLSKGSTGFSSNMSMNVGGSRRIGSFKIWVSVFSILMLSVWTLSLTSGSLYIPLTDVWAALVGQGQAIHEKILFDFRLPRLLIAGISGMAIAVSGSLIQNTIRNPLGDPQVIGITSGAGVGALLIIVVFPQLTGAWLVIGAVLGGITAASIVYSVSWRRGLDPMILTLVGIAVAAAGAAFINILIVYAKVSVAPALTWMAGSAYGRGWSELRVLFPSVVILLLIAWWQGRKVDLLSFSEESSTGLGLKVKQTRLSVAIIAVLLASIAAANVGAVGFIGLLAPHAARMLVGPHHRQAVILSALIGGLLLAAADWIGVVLLAPKELPAGVVTALIGAPYLLYLMYRSAKPTIINR